MKTKAGEYILKIATRTKSALIKDLKELALEFKKVKTFKGSITEEQYLYASLLGRAKSLKEQLERAQSHVDTATYLESFLKGTK